MVYPGGFGSTRAGSTEENCPRGGDYADLSESYIIFLCDFDYFHIGKAVGERVSFLKGTEVPYEEGSHVFFLNSRYTEANAGKPILEFLDLVRTNDVEKTYETPLAQKARERMQEVRSDKALEVSYMTFAQKMLDERRLGYAEGELKKAEETAINLAEMGLSVEQIASAVKTNYPSAR